MENCSTCFHSDWEKFANYKGEERRKTYCFGPKEGRVVSRYSKCGSWKNKSLELERRFGSSCVTK